MKLTLDIENTVTRLPSGKIMLDPFTPENKLVLVCTKTDLGEVSSFWFNHKTHTTEGAKDKLQSQLDKATVIICMELFTSELTVSGTFSCIIDIILFHKIQTHRQMM